MPDTDIHSFVLGISDGTNNKALVHFKIIPKVLAMYHGMVAFKNLEKLPSLVIPSVEDIDTSTNKVLFCFKSKDITDFKLFSDCIKKYCKSPVIKENTKNQTVSIKI